MEAGGAAMGGGEFLPRGGGEGDFAPLPNAGFEFFNSPGDFFAARAGSPACCFPDLLGGLSFLGRAMSIAGVMGEVAECLTNELNIPHPFLQVNLFLLQQINLAECRHSLIPGQPCLTLPGSEGVYLTANGLKAKAQCDPLG